MRPLGSDGRHVGLRIAANFSGDSGRHRGRDLFGRRLAAA
jgi:hypothetical protein